MFFIWVLGNMVVSVLKRFRQKDHEETENSQPSKKIKPDEEREKCPICYETVLEELKILTKCGHSFCAICLLKCVTKTQLCPYCRTPVNLEELEVNSQRIIPARTSPFGCVFVQPGGVGVASYHFGSNENCYISYVCAPNSWLLEDNNRPPNKKKFEEMSYCPVERRFKATVYWDKPFKTMTAVVWEYDFVFAEDFSVIEKGTVRMFDKNQIETMSSTFGDLRSPRAPREGGRHSLWYKLHAENEVETALQKLCDHFKLCFVCNGQRNGGFRPKCGHVICQRCLTETIRAGSSCIHCRSDLFLCECISIETGETVAPALTGPDGQVYIQDNQVGLASYHFDMGAPYISYSNAPDDWLLDSGDKFPLKKNFENWSYDRESRTFSAVINWSPESVDGDAKWEYKFTFSESFTRIESGRVSCYKSDGQLSDVTRFRNKQRALVHDGLVYVLDQKCMLDTLEIKTP